MLLDPLFDRLYATRTGHPTDFDLIPIAGNMPLANPQAGLAFDLEGLDSHQFTIKPAPGFASAERAGEAVECYCMAVLRDVDFANYPTASIALAACSELSNLSDFRGPNVDGKVTPQTIFRGLSADDTCGPYISQFLLHPLKYGAIPLQPGINTFLPVSDRNTEHMVDVETWLGIQNGQIAFTKNRIDPVPRLIRNGRDLSAYVHVDHAFEAFFNATLFIHDKHVPTNPGNPYRKSRTQSGFGTFGLPHVQGLLGLASGCALRAVWFQKWFVHHTLRPEEFGRRLHFMKNGDTDYPIHADVLNSEAINRIYANNQTYLLPQVFPEGCPLHPSYAGCRLLYRRFCCSLQQNLHPVSIYTLKITSPAKLPSIANMQTKAA
jgi:hypothetical protein